jgi:cytochrome c-type biogenesis protein
VVIAARPDLGIWWAPMLAFAAGAVSFASPCVFPLVPGYVAFVTGNRTANLASGDRAAHRVGPIVLFIVGFSLIFTLLGAASASWVPLLKGELGERVAGGFVALTGLVMLAYAFERGVRWIFEDRHPFLSRVRPGTASALPLGMAFAVGWTPCVGPVLAAILGLAATGGAAGGAILLFAYSAGLGAPFLTRSWRAAVRWRVRVGEASIPVHPQALRSEPLGDWPIGCDGRVDATRDAVRGLRSGILDWPCTLDTSD